MAKGVAPKYIFGRLNPAYRPNAPKAAVVAERKAISARGRKKGFRQTTANVNATFKRNAARRGATPKRAVVKQTKVMPVPVAYQPGASKATITAELKKISARGKAKGYKQTTANIMATYRRNLARMATRAKANKALAGKAKALAGKAKVKAVSTKGGRTAGAARVAMTAAKVGRAKGGLKAGGRVRGRGLTLEGK
jgi:hypothetical protein